MRHNLTHITIVEIETPPNIKTKRWEVRSHYGDALLGHLAWFARWRKYAFYPQPETVFEEVCMRDLSDFIVNEMGKRISSRRKEKA